jgi:hypothetical protein
MGICGSRLLWIWLDRPRSQCWRARIQHRFGGVLTAFGLSLKRAFPLHHRVIDLRKPAEQRRVWPAAEVAIGDVWRGGVMRRASSCPVALWVAVAARRSRG